MNRMVKNCWAEPFRLVELNGRLVRFGACVNMMDDDIREKIHGDGIDSEQDFLDTYCAAHLEKYGELFDI